MKLRLNMLIIATLIVLAGCSQSSGSGGCDVAMDQAVVDHGDPPRYAEATQPGGIQTITWWYPDGNVYQFDFVTDLNGQSCSWTHLKPNEPGVELIQPFEEPGQGVQDAGV